MTMKMDGSNPRRRLVLQNILMASLVHTGESSDCQYEIHRPSVSREPLLLQRPRVAISENGPGGSTSRNLERVTLARQAYRAKGFKVLSQTCAIEFIKPYLDGQTQPASTAMTRAAPTPAPSAKSPISSTFPANDIITTYNDSRERLLAESKPPAFASETTPSSLERLSKQNDINGQGSVGLHYRHREKDRAERFGPSTYESASGHGGYDEENLPLRAKNQFRPNGLRSGVQSSSSQDSGALISMSLKQQLQQQQQQYSSPLMVSGISHHQAGRERDDDLPEERGQTPGDGSQTLWQPGASSAGAAASSPRVSAPIGGPASGGAPRRSLNKSGSTPWRSQSHSSGGSSSFSGSSGRASKKEVEPTYADPLVGAPTSLQSRLAELSALESETVRWEKARKLKKKGKDRDD